jgi:ferrochelatase
MRYWHPFADRVLGEMVAAGVRELVALPLYPHYSIATTGSSCTDLRRTMARLRLDLPVREIRGWPAAPDYIACLAARIEEGLAGCDGEPVELLYSAHSLPVQFIAEGDPYVDHLQQTIRAVEKVTGKEGRLCYQSRSGPVEWLGPSTPELIRETAARGGKNLLVVPLSFVSDHVETLYEIDIEYRQMAEALGLRFERRSAVHRRPAPAGARRLLRLTPEFTARRWSAESCACARS